MRDAMDKLSSVQSDFTTAADDAAVAEAVYKVAFAKSRLRARLDLIEGKKPSEAAVDDVATVETEEERMTFLVADAKRDAARQGLNSVRARLESLRSLMASYRDPTGSQ
jgi:hypothetical protein